MPQKFPVGTVPTTVAACQPAGAYTVEIPLLAEGTTKAGDKLKYDSNSGFRILSGELEGFALFDTNAFIVGLLDGDGQLADPEDWAKPRGGGILFNNMMYSAGVPESDDPDEMCAAAEGRQVGLIVRVEKDATGSYPDKNRFVQFFPLKDRSPNGTGPARLVGPAHAGAAQAAAPRPAPAAPARVVVPPRSAPAPAPQAARPSATGRNALIACTQCSPSQDIPRAKWGFHVNQHDQTEDAAARAGIEPPAYVPLEAEPA